MSLSDEVRTEVQNILGEQFTVEEALPKNRYNYRTPLDKIEHIASYLRNSTKARLAHISVVDLGIDGFDVVYHLSLIHI